MSLDLDLNQEQTDYDPRYYRCENYWKGPETRPEPETAVKR